MTIREITVIPIGEDHWGRECFMNLDNERIYAMVDGRLHTTTEDGEPDCPLRLDLKVNIQQPEPRGAAAISEDLEWYARAKGVLE